MIRFSDPERLRERDDVPFHEETQRVPAAEFDSITERIDSHAAIGLTNGDGDVLLMNDGSHGWTLVAVPVDAGQNWGAVAQRDTETLLDTSVVLESVEFVRRIDFTPESDEQRRSTMYDVVFRASTSGHVDTTNEDPSAPSLRWFDDVPDGQDGAIADDIQYVLDP